MGISNHLTCLLRNLYVDKKQQLEYCMEQLIGSRLRKVYDRAVSCHPACLTSEHVMRNAGLDELQAGIKTGGGNNNLRYMDDTTLMAESEEELKSLLMRVKEESERVSLRLNIKKTKFMASSPITAWQIEGEKVEVVTDFLFLGSKITADGNCSHETRRLLLLGRKGMTILDRVLKSGDTTVLTKVLRVKPMVFPVVMYSCEIWTVKKTDTKELMPSNCSGGEDS